MDPRIVDILERITVGVGVTGEHLWTVLVRQAHITGWILLVEYATTALVVVLMWRSREQIGGVIKWFQVHPNDGVSFFGFILAIILTLFFGVWAVGMLFSVDTLITAFVNPEYLAVQKVLKSVGK